ncbi:MAG: cytochrome b/b6 domain-containing protein [Rhodoferax sp.]|nr:cytochrome b/b6 domain-containing protein [Rhodoferax sp.]
MSTKVRVWDLPTRVFHWALVACIVGSVTTAQIGGEAMAWHFRCGYTVLSLLLFRIVWGVVGGRWSRFASFAYSPATVYRYLKGQRQPGHSIGHNPLGAASVLALLAFLLLQVASGLISDDEIATAGPFVRFVSSGIVNDATFYHTNVGKLILIALIALHIGAILFYLFRKGENLVRPMIQGDKDVWIATESSRDDVRSRTLAAAVFLGCVALVAWLVSLAG